MQHDFKWYLGSKSGCSCGFRHLYVGNVSMGFGEPAEWYEEAEEDIEATKQVSSIIRSLVVEGEEVECIDAWGHGLREAEELVGEVVVKFSEIKDAEFRFFERHRFVFKP